MNDPATTDQDELIDFLDRAGKEVKPLGPPSLFHHFGQGLGDASMQGFARIGRGAAIIGGGAIAFGIDKVSEGVRATGDALGALQQMASPFGQAASMPDREPITAAQDWVFGAAERYTQAAVDYWAPNANNLGTAGQVVNGLATGLVPLTLGPAGLVATTQADTAIDVSRAGGTTTQSVGAGTVMGAVTAAGVRMPNAFGTGLPIRIATGATANVALDAAGNVAAGAIVSDKPELQQRFEVTGESIAISALMGGAFGMLPDAPRGSTAAERDATLTVNNADHFNNRTAPGEPASRLAAVQHQQAVAAALDQLRAGEPVNVAGQVDLAGFRLRPELDVPNAPGFAAAVARVLATEGGFVDNPSDRGGATNFGISSRAHPDVDVRNLTREQAIAIYRREYWDAIGAERLPARMQGAAFDAAVNQGVGWTRQAIRQADGDLAAFLKLREARYREIAAADPSQRQFLRGWLNRVGRYRETTAAGESLRARLESDPGALAREYAALPDSKGGTVLNTDTARELAPEYLADRTRSADVHEAASDTIKTLYEMKLAEPTPEGFDPVVLFTAGGTGAGKTSAVQSVGDAFGRPEIVYDTNMNTLASAVDKIDQALAAGRDVDIVYVYRDPVEALTGGAIPRAQRQAERFGTGRTVPLEEHARTHEGVGPTMEALAARYAGDDRVQIRAIDNSRGKGKQRLVELADLPRQEDNSLRERLSQALEEARAAGLSGDLYRGFRAEGRNPGRSGDPPRAGDGGRPQQGDRGQVTAETPLAAAERLAADRPDMQVLDGFNADGSPRYRPLTEALAEIADEQAAAAREASAFQAAAACALRNGVA